MAITIAHTKAEGFPKERIGNVYSVGETQVLERWYCAWDERIDLALELVGSVSGSTVTPPLEYTVSSSLQKVYVTSVDIEPLGLDRDASPLTPKKAALNITYGPLEYDVVMTPVGPYYVSESWEPAAEFITVSKKGLFWDSSQADPLVAGEEPGRLVRAGDWVYTIYGYSDVPDWVFTQVGTVNASSVTSGGLDKTFGAETLLCGNPTLTKRYDSGGIPKWEITTRLAYRPGTWNKFPRGSTSGALVMAVIYDGAGAEKKFYDSSDFGNIIVNVS